MSVFSLWLLDKHIQEAYNICMSTKIVNLSLPEELLKKVDAEAKKEYSSRSDFVRKSLVNQLDSQTLDKEYQEFAALYGTTLKQLAKK